MEAMRWLSLGCAVFLLTTSVAFADRSVPLSDDAIRHILAERIGNRRGVGIVVGIVGPGGRRIIAYPDEPRTFNADTAFEIGSVTKVFTALLLAEMVHRHDVRLTDPVAKFFPPAFSIPTHNGHAITLVDLATHTSGLPFMTDAPLDTFIAKYQLPRDPGAAWEYSNIGYSLLGRALALEAGTDFETLLRSRVLKPLGLNSTAITAPPKLRARIVSGHDASGGPAPFLSSVEHYAAMPAAGGLFSTTRDLLTFLENVLYLKRSPLTPAIETTLRTRRAKNSNEDQALGWLVIATGKGALAFHDGGTLGYASAVACDLENQTGVTVLMNEVGDVGDIARHLLQPAFPLAEPVRTNHVEITLSSDALDALAGKYEAAGEGIFVVAHDAGTLTLESPPDWGLPKLRLRPESQRDFFTRELPLRVTFQLDGAGRSTGMLIFPPRGQKAILATR